MCIGVWFIPQEITLLFRLIIKPKCKVQLVKDFLSRSRSRSFKIKVKFTLLLPLLLKYLSYWLQTATICFAPMSWTKVGQGQGHPRSRQINVFGHISMNIDRIDSEQKPVGLSQLTTPLKVKVSGQGHLSSPTVRVKSTFLAIFPWTLIILTPNKSHAACINALHHQRSRSPKVIWFLWMNCTIKGQVQSNPRPLGLYEWTAPRKVQGQGHPRSHKVKVTQGHPRSRSNWPFWPYFNEYSSYRLQTSH